MIRACGVRGGSLRALSFSRVPLPLISDWKKRTTHFRCKKINIPRTDKPVTEHTIMTIIVVDSFCDTGVDGVNCSGDGNSDNDAEGMDEFMNGDVDGMGEGADDGLDVGDNVEGREELDGYNEGGNDGMDEGVGVSFPHILTVLSLDPDTIREPLLLYDADQTVSLCSVSVCSAAPPATASHSFIVSSLPPDTILEPSGLKATDLTRRKCPVSVCHPAPPATASHTLIVKSFEPDTIRDPSWL